MRRHFGQVGSTSGSKRCRYPRRAGWCPDRRRASSTWSPRLVISSASRRLLYPLYVARIRSWDIGGSRMFFFIVVHAAFSDIGGRSSSVSSVASLALASAISLPGMLLCPGIHWMHSSAFSECTCQPPSHGIVDLLSTSRHTLGTSLVYLYT